MSLASKSFQHSPPISMDGKQSLHKTKRAQGSTCIFSTLMLTLRPKLNFSSWSASWLLRNLLRLLVPVMQSTILKQLRSILTLPCYEIHLNRHKINPKEKTFTLYATLACPKCNTEA
jgi:hypothetical protein